MIQVSAPCKVHLLGEWAVVWGKPALLTTVDLRIKATISPSYSVIASDIKKIIEPLIKKELKLKSIPSYKLEISSEIPMGVHLGTSAGASVVSIAALLSYLKVKWDLNLINKLAYEAEKVFHGNPSGADNSTIVYGGLIWYRKEQENLKIIQKLPFSIPAKLTKNLMIIDTGTPNQNTKEMITKITALFNKKPKLKEKFLTLQEKLVRELLVAIQSSDEKEVIRIIREGEANLESIGVCSPTVKKIIRQIEKVGGAAKICGAGGKTKATGIVLAYHKNRKVIEKIAQTHKLNFFSAELGVEGLRQE